MNNVLRAFPKINGVIASKCTPANEAISGRLVKGDCLSKNNGSLMTLEKIWFEILDRN